MNNLFFSFKGNGPCLGERQGKGEGPYSWIKYSEVRIFIYLNFKDLDSNINFKM